MALFRRGSDRPSARAPQGNDEITAFWEWWTSEGRAAAERSVSGELPSEEFATLMGARVHALGDLAWELSPGETSLHVLMISAEGDPALRPLARRLVLAAPAPDTAWSYVDARPAAAEPEGIMLGADGALVDFDRVRVAARLQGTKFDVTVHHPAYVELSEEARLRMTMLALDAALGEIGTELWLGEIRPSEVAPLDGFGLTALRSVVRDLERQHLDPDGRPRWVMLQGQAPHGPLVAVVRRLLHPVTAPHLDTYVAVTLPYATTLEDGLPDEQAAALLQAFQERLSQSLGTSGEVVAHLSTGGVRTLHLYVDSTAGLQPEIKRIAKSWEHGRSSVHEMHDPGWDGVAHLRQ